MINFDRVRFRLFSKLSHLGRNKILSDSIFYSIGRIIPQIISFIILPILTYHLTVSEFGIVNSMQAMGPILIIVLTFALDRSVLRLYYEIDTELEKKSFLFTVSLAIFVTSTTLMLVIFICNKYVNIIFPSINFYPYYSYSILTIYLNSFSLIPLIYLQVQKKPIIYNLITLGNYIIGISLCVYFVVVMKEGATGMLKGPMISCFIFLPVYLFITFKTSIAKLSVNQLKNAYKFAIPMIPHLLCAWIINFSDRIFLEKYHSQFDIGIFSLGAKINSVILILLTSVSVAYSPHFYEIANKYKKSISVNKLAKYNNMICIIFILIVFSIVFISDEVITILFRSEYESSINVVKILGVSSIFSVFLTFLNLMYYQSKATVPLMYIYILGAAMNIVMNFILVKQLSYIGASYATLAAFSFMFILQQFFSKKYFYVNFNWKELLTLIVFLASLIVLFDYLFLLNNITNLLIKLSIILLIGILFIFNKFKK